jgi:hypothetical protein
MVNYLQYVSKFTATVLLRKTRHEEICLVETCLVRPERERIEEVRQLGVEQHLRRDFLLCFFWRIDFVGMLQESGK